MALTTKAMNSFLIASALSMCATAINTSVDGIIVGRFVSPEALSAVNLFSIRHGAVGHPSAIGILRYRPGGIFYWRTKSGTDRKVHIHFAPVAFCYRIAVKCLRFLIH